MLCLVPESIDTSPYIVGLGALSSLGHDVDSHFHEISKGKNPFRPIREILGKDSRHGLFPGAWIEPRSLLTHRKWSPTTCAALHVARQAATSAGWNEDQLADAALLVGTSRGNAAGWLGSWPGRRPFKLMAASNTIHSELSSAISIELGIFGPNHLVASGCSAGLDALGLAKILLDGGYAKRALVVAADLPLVPILLDHYADSGLISPSFELNPHAPFTSGFVPGEGAAAIALSREEKGHAKMVHFSNNSDGADPVGIPKDGGKTSRLLEDAIGKVGFPSAICPHATGTLAQAQAEMKFLATYSAASFHLLKPYVGHTIGASGVLESVILLRFMQDGLLPPNPDFCSSFTPNTLPKKAIPCRGLIYKLAHGMGGHNALSVFQLSS